MAQGLLQQEAEEEEGKEDKGETGGSSGSGGGMLCHGDSPEAALKQPRLYSASGLQELLTKAKKDQNFWVQDANRQLMF